MATARVTVDEDKCDGCEECVLSCSAEVLEIVDGRAAVVRVEDCLICRTCEEICPKQAITVLEV